MAANSLVKLLIALLPHLLHNKLVMYVEHIWKAKEMMRKKIYINTQSHVQFSAAKVAFE